MAGGPDVSNLVVTSVNAGFLVLGAVSTRVIRLSGEVSELVGGFAGHMHGYWT